MITTASKFFFAAAAAALTSAWIYGWGTGGGLTGPLWFGIKGGVGELAGYTVLCLLFVVMLALGIGTSILRDANPEIQAAVARLDAAPPVTVPSAPSYWPVLGALSVVAAIVGLVASPVVFVIGALGALLVTLEWMVSAWSERATGDADVNRQIRNRLMYPIEIPVAGALAILVLVVSISRVLLTVNRHASSAVAIVIGAIILAVAFLVAYRPKLSKDAIVVLLAIGALIIIGAGIFGAANGHREFHHEGGEEGGSEASSDGESEGAGLIAPVAPLTIDLTQLAS
jgi:hypothetical protein